MPASIRGGETIETERATVDAVDPQWKRTYRLGGFCAFALVVGYLAQVGLFVPVYPPPDEGQAMLEYLDGKTTIWWAIIGLSVLTDILYIFIAFSLYHALKGINREAMLVGSGFKVLFAILELAISWPIYVGLITLSGGYAAATTDAQRAAYVAAADYAIGILNSTLLGVYVLLFPALGTLLISLVMRKGIFNKATAYLGVIAGSLAIVSVVGGLFSSALDSIVIPASLLVTVWFLLLGLRLYKLGRP